MKLLCVCAGRPTLRPESLGLSDYPWRDELKGWDIMIGISGFRVGLRLLKFRVRVSQLGSRHSRAGAGGAARMG